MVVSGGPQREVGDAGEDEHEAQQREGPGQRRPPARTLEGVQTVGGGESRA